MLKNPNKYEIGKTIVYFIRHGDREHIPDNLGIGLRIPGPGLSSLGIIQAKKVAKEISKIKNQIDSLYCSKMQRAIDTAKIIGKKINKKPKIAPGIEEFNKFLWKRKLYHYKFWKHYLLYRKAIKSFNKILDENKGKVVVIVAHGNVIQSLIFRKLGISFIKAGKFHHGNCNISIARYNNRNLDHVCCFNSTSISHD